MNYLKIAEHYKKCFEDHGDNHLGVDWPKYDDTLTRYKVMLDLINENNAALINQLCFDIFYLFQPCNTSS